MNNRQSIYSFGGAMGKGVKSLLIILPTAYLLQLFLDGLTGGAITHWLSIWPGGIAKGLLWQPFTYMFLHNTQSMMHVLMNMLGLYLLGTAAERGMGTKPFLCMYFLSGILAGSIWSLIAAAGTSCIGASGGVFGVLGSFVALYPHQRMSLLFLPMFSFPAWGLALAIAFVELAFLLGPIGGGVAYAVHLIGGLVGFVYVAQNFRPELAFWKKGMKRAPAKPQEPEYHIDALLDKIAAKGMQSLSKKERAFLENTSRKKR